MSKVSHRIMLRSSSLLSCPNCRHHMLERFVFFAGAPLASASLPQKRLKLDPARKVLHAQRTFATSLHRGIETYDDNLRLSRETSQETDTFQEGNYEQPSRSPQPPPPPAPDESATIPSSPSSASPNDASSLDIPWYLQVPPPPSPTLSDHRPPASDPLPTLPPSPPPLLSPLLTHLSTTLGLTRISLLDLRSTSLGTNSLPPTALGADLLMLVATARSIKHLNHSADRLCRWLRGDEWKLSPYADGLLGRNELKIKLRRKARRAKLAASVGRPRIEVGSADDGINTGWICVNVGEVEGGPEFEVRREEQRENLRREGFEVVGGGRGPKVVVQMFTEEKREEVDLEGLYESRRGRRIDREERDKEREEDERTRDAIEEAGPEELVEWRAGS